MQNTSLSTQDVARAAPPLVFIHGSGDSAAVWDSLIAHLSDFTCVALDLPGHGAAINRPGPTDMTIEDYAEALRAELARRNITGACLVGHSLGSALALRLAVNYPALARRLVLVGAGARLRVLPALLAEAQAHPESARRQLIEASFAPGHEDMRAQFLRSASPAAPGMLYRDLAACDSFDMMNELGHVAQPTLVITGEEDRLTPPKYAHFLQERLADAQLVLVPNAGHCVNVEAPTEVANAIRRWLGR